MSKSKTLGSAAFLILVILPSSAGCGWVGRESLDPSSEIEQFLHLAPRNGRQPFRLSQGSAELFVGEIRHEEAPAALGGEAYIADRIRRDAERVPNSANLHAYGIVQLIRGRFDEARRLLVASHHLDPSSKAILNDLSIAEMGMRTVSAETFVRGVSRLVEETDKDSVPFLIFNLALALEGMKLRGQAIQAWQRYLEVDSRSGWAEVAHRRLNNLRTTATLSELWAEARRKLQDAAVRRDQQGVNRLTKDFPELSRRLGMHDLLGEWGRTPDTHSDGLQLARMIGIALEKAGGDRTLSRTVTVIDALDPSDRARLGSAHADFSEAVHLYEKVEHLPAKELFDRALRVFEQFGSPFSLWCRLYLTIIRYNRAEYADALERLDAIAAAVGEEEYPSLVGQIQWMRGLCQYRLADFEAQNDAYDWALLAFRRSGDPQNLGSIETLLAQNLSALGLMDRAWALILSALDLSPRFYSARRQYGTFAVASDLALEMDSPGLASHFVGEAMATARKAGDPLLTATSAWRQALVSAQRGRVEDGLRDIQLARKNIENIPSRSIRDGVIADTTMAAGSLLAETKPEEAEEILLRALKLTESRNSRFRRVPLLATLALARVHRRNLDGASHAFRRALNELLEQGGRISSAFHRVSFSSAARKFFEQEMEVELGRGEESSKLFEIADLSRLVLQSPGASEFNPHTLEVFRHRLGEREGILAYFVLRDRTLLWVVTREASEFLVIDQPRELLEKSSQQMTLAARDGDVPTFFDKSAELFERLLLPAFEKVESIEHLYILADDLLYRLPFSALLDVRTGKTLVETHTVSMLLEAPAGPTIESFPEQPSESHRLLLVSNPAFSGEQYPLLRPLRGAEQSGARVAAMYRDAGWLVTELSGNTASKQNFIRESQRVNVLQLAAHVLSSSRDDALSRIVLAPGKGDAGTLISQEVAHLNLKGTDLVILAGCGSGREARRGDTLGLAREFVNAGVRSVLGSLWEIDDRASGEFLSLFHNQLLAGHPPREALQIAKREMRRRNSLESGSRLSLDSWAFELVQSYRLPRSDSQSLNNTARNLP